MTPLASSRQWHLAQRPTGTPTTDDVRFVTVELPPLAENEVRVQNEFISVDPYMRGRMNDVKSYVPPYQLDRAMDADAVGRVIESRSPDLPVGQLVQHFQGWRDVAQGDASRFTARDEVPGVASSVYLSALGLTGMTAWVGLLVIAGMKPGDTVFVSGAAGAVGSAVGQIARLRGAGRVIGSAGTDEKVALLTGRYGFDAAFNYKSGKVSRMLHEAAPDGIDVYFDNVGGDHLEAAIFAFNDGGRAAICGAISSYNSERAEPGPRNLAMLISKGITLTGFTIPSYQHYAPEFFREMTPLVVSGEFVFDETVIDGVEHAFDAWLRLMRGENTGKMLVRVGGSS
ncbi:NADP-dependent oxidoreductase [soil metagenome]